MYQRRRDEMRHECALMKDFSPSEAKGIITSRHNVFAICVEGDRMFAHMHWPLAARLSETTYQSTQRQFDQYLLLTASPIHSERCSNKDIESRQIQGLIVPRRHQALAYILGERSIKNG